MQRKTVDYDYLGEHIGRFPAEACGRSRRDPNIIENCVRHRGKIHKAVVADRGDYWLVIHYGMFSYKKR